MSRTDLELKIKLRAGEIEEFKDKLNNLTFSELDMHLILIDRICESSEQLGKLKYMLSNEN